MKVKSLWMLIVGILLASGTLLIDRFITDVPDWLAIALSIISIILMIIYTVRNRAILKR